MRRGGLDGRRAVFFDLDNTLLDDNPAYRDAVRATCLALARLHRAIDPQSVEAAFHQISEEYWADVSAVPRAYVDGGLSGAEIRTLQWTETFRRTGVSGVDPAAAVAVYATERRARYRLFADATPLLRALRSRLPLAVITNSPADIAEEKAQVTGLHALVDFVLASGAVGVGKPHPRVFEHALSVAGVEPRDAVYVGDSLINDVGGAQGAGMAAVWLNRERSALPPASPLPDLEVKSLAELMEALSF